MKMPLIHDERRQRPATARLYAFGSNGLGQMGLTHTEDVAEPQAAADADHFRRRPPVCISAGGNHTVILASDGEMFAAGDNTDGRIPWQKPCAKITRFTRSVAPKLPMAPSVETCAATWEATILVCSGRVLSCGTGSRGELGQGNGVKHSPWPEKIASFPPQGTRVVDIAACMRHTVAVLDSGEVYGWGDGCRGQLGEPAEVVWSPRRIRGIPFHAVRVACGREFTYIAGHPDHGAHIVLGSNKHCVRSAAPETVAGYTDIGSGWSSIYVLFASGKLVGWGRNDHGQLPPEAVPPLELMAIGSEHVLAKTKHGSIAAWGWGEHGNCGRPTDDGGNVVNTWNEIPVEGTAMAIAAGCATSFVLVHEEEAME